VVLLLQHVGGAYRGNGRQWPLSFWRVSVALEGGVAHL